MKKKRPYLLLVKNFAKFPKISHKSKWGGGLKGHEKQFSLHKSTI